MGKAIILSRVSTLKQDLAQQTDEVFKFAKADGYDEDSIVLIEDKESAVKLDEEHRLGLIELKQTILSNPGVFDCVYAYEISRIGRRAEVNYSIRNFLQQNKVQLIIIKPYIKLFKSDFEIDDTANMTFAIFNALAENEGYLRKERMLRGKLRKIQGGKYIGGRIPFGYTVEEKTNTIIIDEEQAAIVRKLFTMYVEDGRSTTWLAKYFNETGELKSCRNDTATMKTGVNAICYMLKNKSYIGQKTINPYSKKEVLTTYPQIIPDSLFEAAQQKMQNSKKGTRNSKFVHLLKGIIKDENGYAMIAAMSSNLYKVERRYFNNPIYAVYAPINYIDSIVWHFVKQYRDTTSPAKVKEAIKQTNNQITILEKKIRTVLEKIKECEAKEVKINERIISGKLNEKIGDAMLETNEQQKQQLNTSYIEWVLEHSHLYEVVTRLKTGNTTDISQVTDFEEMAAIIKECVKEVTVKRVVMKGQYEITITFENYSFKTIRFNSYKKTQWDAETGKTFELEFLDRTEIRQIGNTRKSVICR